MFTFSMRSLEKTKNINQSLFTILMNSIETSKVDFGVIHGGRTAEEQNIIFQKGREKINGAWNIKDKAKVTTYADGYNFISKHQYTKTECSKAVDIGVYINGRLSWEEESYIYLGGHIMAIASYLYKQNKITEEIRWGGNWDNDGTIIKDQKLKDLGHFEII